VICWRKHNLALAPVKISAGNVQKRSCQTVSTASTSQSYLRESVTIWTPTGDLSITFRVNCQ